MMLNIMLDEHLFICYNYYFFKMIFNDTNIDANLSYVIFLIYNSHFIFYSEKIVCPHRNSGKISKSFTGTSDRVHLLFSPFQATYVYFSSL